MTEWIDAGTVVAKIFAVGAALFLAWAVFIWQPGNSAVEQPSPVVVEQEVISA